MEPNETPVNAVSRAAIEESKVGPWISMLCHKKLGGCGKFLRITLKEANDMAKDIMCPNCPNVVRRAEPPPAPKAKEVTAPPAPPVGDIKQVVLVNVQPGAPAQDAQLPPLLVDGIPQGTDEPEPAAIEGPEDTADWPTPDLPPQPEFPVEAGAPEPSGPEPLPVPVPIPEPQVATPAVPEPDPAEEERQQERRREEAERNEVELLNRENLARLAREKAFLAKLAEEERQRKLDLKASAKEAKRRRKAERKRLNAELRATEPDAPHGDRMRRASSWAKENIGPFAVVALCALLVLILLALVLAGAIWGWNLIPNPESKTVVASAAGPVVVPTTTSTSPPTTTAPTPTTAPTTTTTAPPPPPDDGVIEVLGPTMIRITLGTTTWSEEVDTGESDPMVYSFSGANNAKLPDTVMVMFMDNGLSGKANAEDNPDEHWDPELSPMKFSGPAGTVIYITW